MLILPFLVLFMLMIGLFNYLKDDSYKPAVSTIETSIEQKPKTIPIKYNNYKGYRASGYFEGGKVTEGLDIYSIRWHKHNGFERLVLDISNDINLYSTVVGTYKIGTELPDSRSIDCELIGYSRFSGSIIDFSSSEIINDIDILAESSNSYFFSISLKKAITYKVFSLPDPARIVIDMKIR